MVVAMPVFDFYRSHTGAQPAADIAGPDVVPMAVLRIEAVGATRAEPTVTSVGSLGSDFRALLGVDGPACVETNTITWPKVGGSDNSGGEVDEGGTPAAITIGPILPPTTIPTTSSVWATTNTTPAEPRGVRLARSLIETLPPLVV